MPPPGDGEFPTSETLISHAKEFALCHGYGLSILRSNAKQVVLKCDRGGRHCNPSLTNEMRQRSTSSRLIGCPFRIIGRQRKGEWHLTTIDPSHNHERSEDMSRHPICRRLDPETKEMLRSLAKAGKKPREILASLRLNLNSKLLVRQDIYNALSSIRREERFAKSNPGNSATMKEAIESINSPPILTESPTEMSVEEKVPEEKGFGETEFEEKEFKETEFEEKECEEKECEVKRFEEKGIEGKREEKREERATVRLVNPNVLDTLLASMKESLSGDMSKGRELFDAFFIIQKEVADVERARLEFEMKKEKLLILERKEVREMEEKARADNLAKLRLEIELEKIRASRA